MTGRATPEWVGKTPDTPIPKHVKLRIWDREGGRCYLAGRKIMPGEPYDFDHKVALVNWTGEGHGNRESNIFPVLRSKHKIKTREDVAIKSKTAAVRAKFILPKAPSRLRSAGFQKAPPQRSATREIRRKDG